MKRSDHGLRRNRRAPAHKFRTTRVNSKARKQGPERNRGKDGKEESEITPSTVTDYPRALSIHSTRDSSVMSRGRKKIARHKHERAFGVKLAGVRVHKAFRYPTPVRVAQTGETNDTSSALVLPLHGTRTEKTATKLTPMFSTTRTPTHNRLPAVYPHPPFNLARRTPSPALSRASIFYYRTNASQPHTKTTDQHAQEIQHHRNHRKRETEVILRVS